MRLKQIDCSGYCEFEDGQPVKCNIPSDTLSEIVDALHGGNLIVYPSDTIYCIGADIYDEQSVKKVFMAKRRPFDMPISVCVPDFKSAQEVGYIDRTARRIMEEFMPGPLIILVDKKEDVPDLLTAGSNTVGIRIPAHPIALKIMEEFGPITSASANLHSKKAPATIEPCRKDLSSKISIYLNCGRTKHGIQSTIVDATGDTLKIVREGPIKRSKIEEFLTSMA
jgi:L-threonylcarbamoyladenylate synthase